MKVTRADFVSAVFLSGGLGKMSVGKSDIGFDPDGKKSISIAKVDGAAGILIDLGNEEVHFVPMANVKGARIARQVALDAKLIAPPKAPPAK